ncbi:SIS domain-containing protein [Bombilactobacillus folatiphilus]|uniref:SIS domain-containing protein n=1 Tax=Bombilactobacillus folatiphilus TaxID=2923362 RepID=A0ABY4P9H2_9LACO|nr:SIS domain-containing protein [Bombilactobacillus folatiphilus]UQS82271.1 SIS domain-containing protein [Bombilactobacillus folatiphilus]
MNLIQQALQQTPTQLVQLMAGSQELFARVVQRPLQQIILTGSGTSYHSGVQMQELMRQKSGIKVQTAYPFLLTDAYLQGLDAQTLFIGISQGGSSLSTFEAMQRAQQAGCTIATMAGQPQAYLDQLADEVLTVDLGEETAGAKTKGYYATKLNLLLLAEYLGVANHHLTKVQFEQDLQALHQVLQQFDHAYERSQQWVRAHQLDFAKTHDLRIVGPANSYGDTLESALKLLETWRIPVTGYEFNEFIHGIYNAIDAQSTIFFIDDGSEPRLAKMLEVLGKWTSQLYVVDLSQQMTEHHFGYDVQVLPAFTTFIEPLVFQLMAALVPESKGIDPSHPKDPQFHTELSSKKFNR